MSARRDAPRWARAMAAVYRALLRLYPPSFYRAFAEPMDRTFRDRLDGRVLRHGAVVGALVHGVRTGVDLLLTVPGEWLSVAGGTRRRDGAGAGLAGALRDETLSALRSLRRAPGLALTLVPTLALGIGAVTAFFSIVNAQLFRPLPYVQPEALVRLEERGPGLGVGRISWSAFRLVQERTRQLEGSGAYEPASLNLGSADWTASVRGARVDAGALGLLGVRPVLGRLPGPDDVFAGRETVVVLGHELWRTRFGGDPAVVGRTVALEGEDALVVGVMPPAFHFPEFGELWAPFPDEPAAVDGIRALARLAPGVSAEAGAAEIRALGQGLREAGALPGEGGLRMAEGLYDRGQALAFLPWLLMGTGLAVLLVVCSNVASVLLARGVRRQAEMAVRASLGASARRLLAGTLVEGALLAAVGGALGLVVAQGILWGVMTGLGANFPAWFQPQLDGRVLTFTVLAASASVGLFGLPPALEGARTNLPESLGGTSLVATRSRRAGRLRAGLITVEVALSFLLVTAGALMASSVLRMGSADLGVDAEGAYAVGLSVTEHVRSDAQQRDLFHRRLLDEARSHLALEAVALRGSFEGFRGGNTPGRDALYEHPVVAQGGGTLAFRDLNLRVVSPGYFGAVGLDLVAGRGLAPSDVEGAPPVVVVAQSLARTLWPEGDAVGQMLRVGGEGGLSLTVVGVASDERVLAGGSPRSGGFHLRALDRLYLPEAQARPLSAELVVRPRSGAEATLPTLVRQVVRAVDPAQAVTEVEPLGAQTQRIRRAFGALALILVGLAGSGAGLAVLGVWGLIARTVAERSREIGIRAALGGGAGRIVRGVMAGGLKATLAGLVAGFGLVILFTRLVGMVLYQVDPLEPTLLLATTALFGMVGLAATWLPARRATRVDVVEALRSE